MPATPPLWPLMWFTAASITCGSISKASAQCVTKDRLGLQPLVGAEGFKSFHRAMCALLRDTDLVIDHHIEAGSWLAVLCTFTGTSANGQRVATNGAIHARIADGKIHEAYNHFDFIGLFAQLGLLPGDTFERCLAGQRIGPG
jgi:hypothetical protein